MDDFMPETLTQPFMGTGDPCWYFGQIRLFPELGALLPQFPVVTTTQECGVRPRPPPRLSVVLSVVLSGVQRMLSAQEEAWTTQNASARSFATQYLPGGALARGIRGGGVAPPQAPSPSEPRAADTHPRAVTGRGPGQGRAAGLVRGDLLSRPLLPDKAVFLPNLQTAGTASPGFIECLRGRDALSRQALWGAPLGPGRGWVQGPPGWGAGLGSWVEALAPLPWCPESPVPESKPSKEEGPGGQQAGLLA